jgi:hypothetical protein
VLPTTPQREFRQGQDEEGPLDFFAVQEPLCLGPQIAIVSHPLDIGEPGWQLGGRSEVTSYLGSMGEL